MITVKTLNIYLIIVINATIVLQRIKTSSVIRSFQKSNTPKPRFELGLEPFCDSEKVRKTCFSPTSTGLCANQATLLRHTEEKEIRVL